MRVGIGAPPPWWILGTLISTSQYPSLYSSLRQITVTNDFMHGNPQVIFVFFRIPAV
ncbi:MAG: hypothetical protein ACTS7E_02465 [Arsenophonus sp. NC-CH8-MAG3]